jgi:hypothetical protein
MDQPPETSYTWWHYIGNGMFHMLQNPYKLGNVGIHGVWSYFQAKAGSYYPQKTNLPCTLQVVSFAFSRLSLIL